MQVSLATPIWQRTFPYMLGEQGMLARNMRMLRDIDFSDVMVLVNNGVPVWAIQQYWARTWVRYIKSDVAVRKFPAEIPNVDTGFWYSAGPLAAIAMCRTPYLLFIADDVELVRAEPGWLMPAIAAMQADERIMCATPMWHKSVDELVAEHPDNHKTTQGVMTRGFSDHAFLIRVADFRQPIYGYEHAESDVLYPVDGAFEKRIGAYMRATGKYRLVIPGVQWKHESYGHAGNHRRPKPTIDMPREADFDR